MSMQAEQILEMFVDALDQSGTVAFNNDNGADSYECPCCLSEVKIKGYALSNASITMVAHEGDCELFNAYQEALEFLSK